MGRKWAIWILDWSKCSPPYKGGDADFLRPPFVQYDPAKIRSWGDPARNIAKPDLKQMELSLLHISSLKSRKSGDPISVILATEIPTKNRLQQVQALIPVTPPLQGLRWNDP
jgi:hypothetical protein